MITILSGSRWLRYLPWIVTGVMLSSITILALNPALGIRLASYFTWLIQPIFHDWWVVKEGLEAHAVGIDPLAAAHLPYNYPRLLLLMGSALHLQSWSPLVAGVVLAGGCLGALSLFLRKDNLATIIVGSIALLSPPVWMLLERGNIDSLIIALVILGLGGVSRKDCLSLQITGVACLLLASLLKFYPAIIMIGGIVAWPGTVRRMLLIAVALFLGSLTLQPNEPGMILRKTGRGLEASYGWSIAGSRPFVVNQSDLKHKPTVMRSSFYSCLIILLAASFAGLKMRFRINESLSNSPWQKAGFWAGALVYAGTFALGANWAYRLAFLILCLPAILSLLQNPACRRWAFASLILIAITLFAPFHLNAPGFYFVQASHWLLVGFLTTGAVAVMLARPRKDDSTLPTLT